MSKKINLGTINTESMEKFSNFHVATASLKSLREQYKSDKDKISVEIAKVVDARKTAKEKGMSDEDATAKFSLEPCYKKLNKLDEELKANCKPYNESKRDALKLLPVNLHYAYRLAMLKGDLNATGKLVTKRDPKTNEVKEEVTLDKSLKCYVKDFLTAIGLDASNDTALTKFAQTMAVWTGGMMKSNKGEDFLKAKGASQFNELFMLAFLQYTIREKGIITVNADNTLSMTVFESTDSETK